MKSTYIVTEYSNIHLRMTEQQKDIIEQAAHLRKRSTNRFCVRLLLEEAERTLHAHRRSQEVNAYGDLLVLDQREAWNIPEERAR